MDYYTIKALSQSGIKKYINDGPHRFWAHSVFNPNKRPDKETEALLTGKLVDVLLFTPNEFDSIYAVKEKMDGRTKDGKAYNEQFALDNANKVVISTEDFNDAATMVTALKANPDFIEVTKGEWLTQEEFMWSDGEIAFKAKMDLIVKHEDGSYTIFDYKTCQNCDEQHFGKDIVKYGYHIQAYFYKEAFFQKYGVTPRFVLIPQEKEYTDCIALWEVQPCDIAIGQRSANKAIKEIKARLNTGNWKPSKGGIQEMNLPSWFYTKNMEDELINQGE